MTRKAQNYGDEERQKYVTAMIDNLPLLRAKLGLSQEELGKQIGISRQQVANFENRKRTLTWTSYLALVSVFSKDPQVKQMMVQMGICREGGQDSGALLDDDLSAVAGGLEPVNSIDFEVAYAGNLSAAQITSMVKTELRTHGVPETVIANMPNIEIHAGGASAGGKLKVFWQKGEQSISYISIY